MAFSLFCYLEQTLATRDDDGDDEKNQNEGRKSNHKSRHYLMKNNANGAGSSTECKQEKENSPTNCWANNQVERERVSSREARELAQHVTIGREMWRH